jgi:hypothetical protein
MKTKHCILIALFQLLLCAPMLLYFPLAILGGLSAIWLLILSEPNALSQLINLNLAWIGLAGLYSSILSFPNEIRKKPKFKRIISYMITSGFIATILLLYPEGIHLEPFSVWIIGGPVVVGIWNVIWIHTGAQIE